MIGAGTSEPPASGARQTRSNLVTRIVWAFVLGSVAIGLCLLGRWPFALLLVAGGAVVLWEWGRLVGDAWMSSVFAAQTLCVAIAALAITAGRLDFVAAAFVSGVAATALLAKASDRKFWLMFGVLYAGLPAVALGWLRADPEYGALAILFLFVVVWTADSTAYASGRLIGGPKISPRLSPRKTWAGLIGGSIFPMAGAAAFAWFVPGTSAAALAVLGLILALCAHIGDLGESAVKRRFGVKDTSALIPGHGGLLDRIDGLLFAALAASAIALVRNPARPGEALLLWP